MCHQMYDHSHTALCAGARYHAHPESVSQRLLSLGASWHACYFVVVNFCDAFPTKAAERRTHSEYEGMTDRPQQGLMPFAIQSYG